jgi:hypothetical protein
VIGQEALAVGGREPLDARAGEPLLARRELRVQRRVSLGESGRQVAGRVESGRRAVHAGLVDQAQDDPSFKQSARGQDTAGAPGLSASTPPC